MIKIDSRLLARVGARDSRFAWTIAAFFVAIVSAGCALMPAQALADQTKINWHIVRTNPAVNASGDRVCDRLKQAIDRSDYDWLPSAVIRPHSAMAVIKGAGNSDATVVDAIVCFDHVPGAQDIAALKSRGFTVKEVLSHAIYAVHVIGPVAGSKTLTDMANPSSKLGITYIGPNNVYKPLLQNSTRQIGARQSWTTYEQNNYGLPLTGDPQRSIAIMDTGIDGTHPDLNGGTAATPGNKIIGWIDVAQASPTPNDPDGHGSHVAGIAAGTGYAGGVATGTGYVPITIQGIFEGATSTTQQNDDNVPVNTTGFTGTAQMPVAVSWSQLVFDSSNAFFFFDQNYNQIPGASFNEYSGAALPIVETIPVPTNVDSNYYFKFSSNTAGEGTDPTNASPFFVHVDAPQTAVGDGFNLMSGVAPTSSLVGVEAADSFAEGFSDSSIADGIDYVSQNQSRYNIGVVNMSFGSSEGIIDPVMDSAVDSLVEQGVVCTVAAGNNGNTETVTTATVSGTTVTITTTTSPNVIGSPASASEAITVAALGPANEIADYSSTGSAGVAAIDPTSTTAGTPAIPLQSKPDLAAPGGEFNFDNVAHQEDITSVHANGTDNVDGVGQTNIYSNDYTNHNGTSMAAPHVAGAVALIEQALAIRGSLGGLTESGGEEAHFIKALLEMTSTATNVPTDAVVDPINDPEDTTAAAAVKGVVPPGSYEPIIGIPTVEEGNLPGTRNQIEGYGKMNVDAALEAVLQTYYPGDVVTGTLGPNRFDPHAWARNVAMKADHEYTFTVTAPTAAEYDLYLYSTAPAGDGNYPVSSGAVGDPVILASSAVAGQTTQTISYTPSANEEDILVVRWVTGSGSFTLTSAGTPGASSTITVTNAAGVAINGALVTVTDPTTGLEHNIGTTNTGGQVELTTPTLSNLTATASAFGYITNSVGYSTGAAQTSAKAKVALQPSHVFSTGLQMISVPYGYTTGLSTISSPPIYIAAVYEPQLQDYALAPQAPADEFHLGTGYWVRLKQPIALSTQGYAITAANFSISLAAGWNMIGDPFTVASPLSTATVTDSSGGVHGLTAAITSGLVGTPFEYNTTTNAYQALTSSDSIEPYVGYWIYSSGSATLVLQNGSGPPPPP